MHNKTSETKHTIVLLTKEHIPSLLLLECAYFTLSWSKTQYETAMEQATFKAFGLFEDTKLIAYISLYLAVDSLEILNIAVATHKRRKGYGHYLLSFVLQFAEKIPILEAVLEVQQSNVAAIALYTAHNFILVGRRKNYYTHAHQNTHEDALIYQRITIRSPMHPLIAANWKMYKTQAEAHTLATGLAEKLCQAPDKPDVIIFAPFTALDVTVKALERANNASVGAQNVYPAKEGAFTGEIAPDMLKELGCQWVLAGHSERRQHFAESPAFVGEKTVFALNAGLKVMLCVGETLEERKQGQLETVLTTQLKAALANIPKDLSSDRLAIAYEPVWAIGTGQVASNDDITHAHTMLRKILISLVGETLASLRLLYGGSVKPENASTILRLDNVNGLLVGGASLQLDSFTKIVFS